MSPSELCKFGKDEGHFKRQNRMDKGMEMFEGFMYSENGRLFSVAVMLGIWGNNGAKRESSHFKELVPFGN